MALLEKVGPLRLVLGWCRIEVGLAGEDWCSLVAVSSRLFEGL